MSLVAGVEEFTLAVGRDGEDLAFVACGYVEHAIGAESDVPNVFCFGIEEDGFFAGRGDAIDLAVGGCSDVKRAFGVEGDGLSDKIGRFKKRGRLACPVAVEAEDYGGRATRCVERTLRVDP